MHQTAVKRSKKTRQTPDVYRDIWPLFSRQKWESLPDYTYAWGGVKDDYYPGCSMVETYVKLPGNKIILGARTFDLKEVHFCPYIWVWGQVPHLESACALEKLALKTFRTLVDRYPALFGDKDRFELQGYEDFDFKNHAWHLPGYFEKFPEHEDPSKPPYDAQKFRIRDRLHKLIYEITEHRMRDRVMFQGRTLGDGYDCCTHLGDWCNIIKEQLRLIKKTVEDLGLEL